MSEPPSSAPRKVLVVRAQRLLIALDLAQVIETMRPLEVARLEGLPAFVLGLSVIRGKATPVVSLPALVAGRADEPLARFVTLRSAQGVWALAVSGVEAIGGLGATNLEELPPLIQEVRREAIEALAEWHGQLLLVLNTGRVIPDALWAQVRSSAGASRA